MNRIEIFGYLKDFKSKSLLIPFCLALLMLMINNYLLIGIFALLLFLLTVIISDKILVAFTIISFLALPSTVSSDLRVILQVFNFSVLVLMFINKYGLQIRNYPRIPKLVGLLVFFVLFSMSISTLFSDYTAIGITQLIRTIEFFVLIYLYFALLTTKTDVYWYIGSLFFTSIIFSFTQYYELQRAGFRIIEFTSNMFVIVGSEYVHHNLLGAFYIILISIMISFLFFFNNKKIRYAILFYILLLLVSLFFTNSRSAVICLLISTFFILYKLDKKKLLYVIIFIVLIISLFFIPPLDQFAGLYFRFENIVSGRDFLFRTAIDVIKHNPVFGAGPAASKFEMYKYMPYLLGSPEELFIRTNFYMGDIGQAHNFYLFFFSDLGIVGFLTAVSLPFVFLKIGFRSLSINRENKSVDYYIILSIIGIGIGLFVRGLLEPMGFISYGYILADLPFWLLFCILTFYYRNRINENKTVS